MCCLTLYIHVLSVQLSYSIVLTKLNVYFMLHFKVVFSVHFRSICAFMMNN